MTFSDPDGEAGAGPGPGGVSDVHFLIWAYRCYGESYKQFKPWQDKKANCTPNMLGFADLTELLWINSIPGICWLVVAVIRLSIGEN